MTKFSRVSLLVLQLAPCAYGAETRTERKAEPMTQTELNSVGCQEQKKLDSELNKLYKKILGDPFYAKEKRTLLALKEMQRSWVKFRNAVLDARFPGKDKQENWGSTYPMCACSVEEDLTRKQIELLKAWDAGEEEGYVCSGSIKTH
jgi:uncharacterized protein YecT (DUF1311 family)